MTVFNTTCRMYFTGLLSILYHGCIVGGIMWSLMFCARRYYNPRTNTHKILIYAINDDAYDYLGFFVSVVGILYYVCYYMLLKHIVHKKYQPWDKNVSTNRDIEIVIGQSVGSPFVVPCSCWLPLRCQPWHQEPVCGCLERVDCGSIVEVEKVVNVVPSDDPNIDDDVTYQTYKQYKKLCKFFYISQMNGILAGGTGRGMFQALVFLNLWINHEENGENCEELNEPSHLFYVLSLYFINFIDMQTLYHEFMVCDLLEIGSTCCEIRYTMAMMLATVLGFTLAGFLFSLIGYFIAVFDVIGTTFGLLIPAIALITIRTVLTLRLPKVVAIAQKRWSSIADEDEDENKDDDEEEPFVVTQ